MRGKNQRVIWNASLDSHSHTDTSAHVRNVLKTKVLAIGHRRFCLRLGGWSVGPASVNWKLARREANFLLIQHFGDNHFRVCGTQSGPARLSVRAQMHSRSRWVRSDRPVMALCMPPNNCHLNVSTERASEERKQSVSKWVRERERKWERGAFKISIGTQFFLCGCEVFIPPSL